MLITIVNITFVKYFKQMETIDFVKKLETILAYYQLSASAFADKIGFQRSSMSHLLAGRNKPSLDFVMKVSTTFKEVDINWFLFNQGTFPKALNQNEKVSDASILKVNEDLKAQNEKLKNDLQQLLAYYNEMSSKTDLFSEMDSSLKIENINLKSEIASLKAKLSESIANQSSSSNNQLLIEENQLLKDNVLELNEKIQVLNDEIKGLRHLEIKLLNVNKDLDQLLIENKDLKLINSELNQNLSKLKQFESNQSDLIEINKTLQIEFDKLKLAYEQIKVDFENHDILQQKLCMLEQNNKYLSDNNAFITIQNSKLNAQIEAINLLNEEQKQTIIDLKLELDNKSSEPKSNQNDSTTQASEIEMLVVLYKNGIFKEYKK